MQCPYCRYEDTSVLESRVAEDGAAMRRRRECLRCGKRFTTYERAEGVDIKVIKKDGRRERFDREKLRKGIVKATWKRPVAVEEIEKIVDEVEMILRKKKSMEVRSWEIGNLVINRLRKLDPLAYLLFASVYRDFRDLDDFELEIKKLKEKESK